MFDNIFETVNSGFAQALYEDYLKDPQSVPPEWRALFENGVKGEEPVGGAAEAAEAGEPAGASESPAPSDGSSSVIKGPALRLLENMEASLEVPTATSFRDIDVGILWDVRKALNAQLADEGIKLSFTHLIGWAIVQAAAEYPVMTHVVKKEDGGDAHRIEPDGVHFGLAVDVEGRDGKRKLLVPVVKGAGGRSFSGFYEEYERLVAGARDGKLMPDAYMGGTITLTNPGTIGTVASVPRLMKGQGSIIATGAIREVGGERIMTISSTYDHRIIQGAESGLFLQRVDQLLQGEDGFYDLVAEAMGVDLSGVAAGAADAAEETAAPPASAAPAAPEGPVAADMLYHVAAAMGLVKAHRMHGYLAATLDPLGTAPTGDPALDPEPLELTEDVMRRIPADILRVYVEGETLADVYPRLQEVYCGNIAYEIEHIASHEERVWLRRVIESGEHRMPLSAEQKRGVLETLTRVEGLEKFLHRAFLGAKRFSIEGLDMLVPMLHTAIDLAHRNGCNEVAMGMAHRGRLNVLAHVLGRSYATLLAEFEGGRKVEETLTPEGGTGDVKYHHGASGEYETAGGTRVPVNLLPNPSHLEAVDPVVEGWTRARQSDRAASTVQHDPGRVLPILMHGDAAFAAQGVVAETFNLSRLGGYATGGTLHIIENNQLGFTTPPKQGRSTDFASDLAKGFDVPVIHVNADDPQACLDAVRLAMMYRARFSANVVINLVGYRRYGHNEADEPRYTQPEMYERVDEQPTVRDRFVRTLVDEGVLTEDDARQLADEFNARLQKAKDRLEEELKEITQDAREPNRSSRQLSEEEPATAVDRDRLAKLNEAILAVPDGFTVNRKLQKAFDRRKDEFDADDFRFEWAHGEALALASLLTEGTPVRLTGQDSERGTFSHRHAVLHDQDTGNLYVPLQHLPEQKAAFEIHNSPLSEYACLGFEQGYAVAVPEGLVLWEAQFGDFVNGAEIIIDQFIVAGYAKWGQTSRLTLLLPHGYEGQGPEHSSARVERFLALAAEHNIRVANCSTPAQYFHLLRRQALHPDLRPLVIMTPKSLLRLPAATSRLADFTDGRFQPVLDDDERPGSAEDVRRVVFCSGKLFYDITGDERRAEATHVAIARIELLYPFPSLAVDRVLERYPNLEEIVWAQEEPQNFGARKWTVPHLTEVAGTGIPVRYVSRPERASPAEGYPKAHQEQQRKIVDAVLAD